MKEHFLTIDKIYDKKQIDMISSHLKSGMTAIDAGAYTGSVTNLFGKLVTSSGKIFAFEPSKETFIKLCDNTKDNKHIRCINSAISDYHGCGYLCIYGPPTGYCMVDPLGAKTQMDEYIDKRKKNFEKINVTYIDKFCEDNLIEKVDFIKIDVEGQELEVLYGAEKTIDRSEHIKLIIEIHNQPERKPLSITKTDISFDMKHRFPDNNKKIHKFLKDKEFKAYHFNKDRPNTLGNKVTENNIAESVRGINEIIAIR